MREMTWVSIRQVGQETGKTRCAGGSCYPYLTDHCHVPSLGQRWLNANHLIGQCRAFLPYVGVVTIAMNDYPMLKYGLIGLLGIFVLVNRE